MLAGPFLIFLTGHGGGLAERMALYPLIIWLIAFGSSMRKLRANCIPESIQKGDSSTVSRGQAKVTLSYGADED
jgi:uncharacterized membrane protein